MGRLSRAAAAVGRGAARLVPAGRRDWAEAVWAEAHEVSPGLRRLAWRAGGVRLIAREALIARRIGSAMLFAVAVAFVASRAWRGSSANAATLVDRVDVITTVLLLAGLALLARRFFGPARDSRMARFLRVGGYAAILALMLAKASVEQFADAVPQGGVYLRLYRDIQGNGSPASLYHWFGEILFLVIMAGYVAAILWLTSRRSPVVPATLAIGTGAGIVLGVVIYAVAPLGLSESATNPWLPGSGVDPLVALAWMLLLGAPVAAALVAGRRYSGSGSSLPLADAKMRQGIAAGLLANLVGALFVTLLGTGTIALMSKAAWLRHWLYGQHLLGAVAYSHELTASTDAVAYFLICLTFPMIGFGLSALGVVGAWGNSATGPADPRRGGGGPPGPEPAPDPPDGSLLAGVTDDEIGLAVSLLSLHLQGPGIEQDPIAVGLADAAGQPVGTR